MKENNRKCLKCGSSPAEDPETTLFRFPKPGSTNITRCELWAKYCFPNKEWSTIDFQVKLYAEHRMLCHRHFKESAFLDSSLKKLRRFASPEIESVTMPFLAIADVTKSKSGPLLDVTNTPSTLSASLPGPSSLNDFHAKCIQSEDQTAYRKCKKYIAKICQLRKKLNYMKNKKLLQELNNSSAVNKLANKISPTFALLLQAQIKNFKKSVKGRRWSSEDKITALRLYKRSPTCYRLLRRMFCLPAPSTLKVILRNCSLDVGINKGLFEVIHKYIGKLEQIDNEFVLMFDEMSLKKHLQYNARVDAIEGYQDHGVQGRTAELVTHALVFMVAGIRKKIKQPIAYYLSGSFVTADRLTALIKEVVVECQEHDINIAATVCDMNAVNRRALSILGATTSSPHFNIQNKEIVALFDVPHLVKCFRNMFIKHDIVCKPNISTDEKKGAGLAKWSHIVSFYELDNANNNFVFAPCLKQEHLNPNTKQKMKVKLAVQVLSHTVAAGMFAKVSQGELTPDAVVTADLISKMDKLFDTLNSDSADLRRGKPFATNLKKTSPHIPFIREMKLFFEKIEFVGSRTPPSQEGWLWTLNGIESLWERLCQKHNNFKSLATRRLQQDPLENLFGCIRSNCGANCNPTTGQFVAGLKTTILSNLSHICNGNCENDKNYAIIDNFKLFMKQNVQHIACTEDIRPSSSSVQSLNLDDKILEECGGEIQACTYVCGFIIKNYKHNCVTCTPIFTTAYHTQMHIFTDYKEYDDYKKSLKYANENFVLCVEQCATLINEFLKNNAYKRNVIKEITIKLKEDINFDFLNNCIEHKDKNLNYIIKSIAHIVIKRFCILNNRSFTEKNSKSALKKKINILKHN